MAAPALQLPVSWEDYVAADEAFDGKLELLHGEVYAMAGGTPAHAHLTHNLAGIVYAALKGTRCHGTSNDQRIGTPSGDAVYPDVTIRCAPPELRSPHTLLNPSAVVEVLSPTTEGWDRSGKLELYRSIPTMRHVLLVSYDAWRMTLVSRRDDGSWSYETAGPGERLALEGVGMTVEVDEVYAGVEEVGGPARDAVPRKPRTA